MNCKNSINLASVKASAIAAGVTEDEMNDHPALGLLISASGVLKLAALAPDMAGKLEATSISAADRADHHSSSLSSWWMAWGSLR